MILKIFLLILLGSCASFDQPVKPVTFENGKPNYAIGAP